MNNGQENRVILSKVEVARRQLETAINMYFNDGEPVSIHTLVTAAFEVLRDINSSRNGSPMFTDPNASVVVPSEKKGVARQALRKAQNFFKHADEDPDGVLDFNPEATAFYILDAVEKYRELNGENPPIMRVFALWARVQWTDVFSFSNGEASILILTRSLYPLNNKAKFYAEFFPRYVAMASYPSQK
jgi:hypothetical protein